MNTNDFRIARRDEALARADKARTAQAATATEPGLSAYWGVIARDAERFAAWVDQMITKHPSRGGADLA